ncbi:leucyl aminopeptidase [Acidithiobacillus sulfuriphilus]|uniref:Leucyl aminopeptidase n=2 Tax=Acidithiobacillus sulfuriphilus TaxID=1867749 RepID=A0ACD5HPU4_9PROT|nr:leucyl aminopeptidase [Acidithiobacillus sulfuriphilus]RNF66369.1 leucyl aminopeptidase [Acidithiobacillus sulfuriphilus]
MEIAVKPSNPVTEAGACIVVGVFEDQQLTPAAAALDSASHGLISAILQQGDLQGQVGQTLLLYRVPQIKAERVLLVGLGKVKKCMETGFQKAAAAAAQALQEAHIGAAVFYLADTPVSGHDVAWTTQILARSIAESGYRFDKYRTPPEKPAGELGRAHIALPEGMEEGALQQAVARAQAIARASAWARDLANEPGNVCTPSWLADQASAMAHRLGIQASILGPEEMEVLGMRLLLGVASGSSQPPRLIVLEYHGAPSEQQPIVLVGKGLTFDAGGISLKPGDKMDEMKYDMCGGASVLAAIQAAAELKLPINVVAVVPASENLPDGKANKPGDIQKSMNGLTVEILNTDAEGRLILADALTYVERFKPDVVIDVATLTGACVIALGHQTAGLLGNNQRLIHDLLAAGREGLDRAWEMPLWEEYQEQLKSPFADLGNIGGRPAGTITAACFLSRFAENYHWAHLDIAGVAWKSGEKKGATGRPVPLLVNYLLHRAAQQQG